MWACVHMLVFVAKQWMTVKVTVGQPAGGPLDLLAGPEQDSRVASRCGGTLSSLFIYSPILVAFFR